MKLKKIATILLSAMLSIGVLAGCSNNSSNSSADTEEEKDAFENYLDRILHTLICYEQGDTLR